ncbi:hypothetical protein Dimus_030734 [Dionaea muscipula]
MAIRTSSRSCPAAIVAKVFFLWFGQLSRCNPATLSIFFGEDVITDAVIADGIVDAVIEAVQEQTSSCC